MVNRRVDREPWVAPTLVSVHVEVVTYDSEWPKRFASVREELRIALAAIPVIAIEHVGSTSIPGLAAKPTIDVDVVAARDDVRTAIAALEAIGYASLGDLGVPDRYALRPPADGVRRNVYVVVDGCLALRNHRAVRARCLPTRISGASTATSSSRWHNASSNPSTTTSPRSRRCCSESSSRRNRWARSRRDRADQRAERLTRRSVSA